MLRASTRRACAVLALFMLSVVVRADNTAQTLPFGNVKNPHATLVYAVLDMLM